MLEAERNRMEDQLQDKVKQLNEQKEKVEG